MKTTVSYKERPAPKADAVADIQAYLGDRYDAVASIVKPVTNKDQFAIACSFVGIEGFPVGAWYEHFHGEGKWEDAA